MLDRSVHRGEGKLGCIFWLAILAVFIMIAWQIVPAKIDTGDLDDFMVRQAESAGSNSAEQIKQSILLRAKDLGLPVTKDNLSVVKTNARVAVKCEYELPVSMVFYTYQWKVTHDIDRPYFLF